jgi:hypothetical protein
MHAQVNKFGVNNSAGFFKQFRIIYKTCCSVKCGYNMTTNKYGLTVRDRTFRVTSVFFNVKFSPLIYVKNYRYGSSITLIDLYLPLVYRRACIMHA